MQEFSTQVRNALAAYLTKFPEEVAGLTQLQHQLDIDSGDIGHRANMRGHITTSAVVVDHTHENAILIHHKVYNDWLQPGGHYEGTGSLPESAAREVTEETGVVDPVLHGWCKRHGAPIDIDTHAIAAHAGKQEGAHVHHDFLYLMVAPPGCTLVPQLAEVYGVKWLPIAELSTLPGKRLPRLATRVRAVLDGAIS